MTAVAGGRVDQCFQTVFRTICQSMLTMHVVQLACPGSDGLDQRLKGIVLWEMEGDGLDSASHACVLVWIWHALETMGRRNSKR
jgi:hypothetical protein